LRRRIERKSPRRSTSETRETMNATDEGAMTITMMRANARL
jgi:hypothetical protein